jgi:hypothetical protein
MSRNEMFLQNVINIFSWLLEISVQMFFKRVTYKAPNVFILYPLSSTKRNKGKIYIKRVLYSIKLN